MLDGGPLIETTALLTRLRAASKQPMFAAAELGAGVGERFAGATALPPLAAFNSNDLDGVRRAARITAREARGAGITWAIAPSCVRTDLAAPIVRSRTFSGDNENAVAAACGEWIDGCHAEGVVATPGPYPLMRPAAADAGLDAGANAMLLAVSHATDAECIDYLRNDAAYGGVIAVPLSVVAAERGEDEETLAVQCINAGCDLLMGAEEPREVMRALELAVHAGIIDRERVLESVARVDARAEWCAVTGDPRQVTLDDALWARRLADASVHAQKGRAPALRGPVELIVIDDDPPRLEPAGKYLAETLTKIGHDVRRTDTMSDGRGTLLIAVVGDRRIGLGFDDYSDGAIARAHALCDQGARAARDVIVVHFTPPDFGGAFSEAPVVVCAWSGTRAMEEAAARWLTA
jgi:beta-glucosidase